MLYLKSRVFHTLVPHVPCVTPSHKNLIKSFSSFLSGFSIIQKLEKSVQSLCLRKARPAFMRRRAACALRVARSARAFKGRNSVWNQDKGGVKDRVPGGNRGGKAGPSPLQGAGRRAIMASDRPVGRRREGDFPAPSGQSFFRPGGRL